MKLNENRNPGAPARKIRRRLTETSGIGSKMASTRKAVPSIELYQKEECPFSHRVRQHLSELGLDYVAHSVPEHNDLKHKQLVQAGGKDQVPFLVDNKTGTKLYESEAILSYLKQEYGAPEVLGQRKSLSDRAVSLRYMVEEKLRGRVLQVGHRVHLPFDLAKDTIQTLSGTVRMFRSFLPSGLGGKSEPFSN